MHIVCAYSSLAFSSPWSYTSPVYDHVLQCTGISKQLTIQVSCPGIHIHSEETFTTYLSFNSVLSWLHFLPHSCERFESCQANVMDRGFTSAIYNEQMRACPYVSVS